MNTKRLLLAMLALFAIFGNTNIYGQSIEGNFSASPNPVTIKAGSTAQVTLNLSNYSAFTGYEFLLVLPEGITLNKAVQNKNAYPEVYNEDEEEYQTTHSMQRELQSDGSYKFICISTKTTDPFVATKMITLTLAAASDATGSLTASLTDIALSTPTGGGVTPTNVNFTITIQGKPTVTADNKSREYGEANPELTYTVSDGTITGTPVLATTATATSPVGEYPISVEVNDEYNTAPGTLTVTAAPLTINGGTYTIKQGDALPTFAAVYTGFKNNETSTVLTSQPVLTLEDGVTGASAPGTYTITVTGGEAINYTITRENGTLTINEADAVTVKANNLTMAYGDEVPELTYTSEGADLAGAPSLSCSATSSSPVGTYPIVITKGTVTNYNDTYVNGTLTITQKEAALGWSNTSFTYTGAEQKPTATVTNLVGNDVCTVTVSGATDAGNHTSTATELSNANYKLPEAKTQAFTIAPAALTITADVKSKVYGDNDPELTYTSEGLIGADAIIGALTRTEGENVGEYNITQGTLTAGGNYEIGYTSAKLTITQKEAALAWSNTTFTYTGAEQKPTATVTNLVGNDVCTVTVSGATDAGNHTSTAMELSNANYILPEAKTQAFSIAKAAVTVTADAKSKVYGDNDPELTYTSEGLIGTDAITGALTRTEGENVGEYNITQGTLTAGGNYEIGYIGAKLTITQKEAALAWSNTEFTYTGAEQKPTATVTNLVGEDVCTVTVSGATVAGNHTSTASELSNANYKLPEAKTQAFSIAKAAVTVTADAKSKVYGDADPELTYTSNGLVGNDAITGELTRTEGENVGEYNITQGTLTAGGNYEIGYTGAKLTINQKEATLAWSNTTFTYTGAEQKPTATVTNLVGNDVCTVTVSGATNAGNHTSTATELSNANYKLPEAKTQVFAIAQAALTISCGTYTMKQGDALPEFQAEYNGFVNGENESVLDTKPILSTTATTTSSRGNYDVVVSGAVAANYDISYQNGTLIITEVVANEGGTTIEQGEDGYYVVTIDEESGVTSESGVIADTQLDEGKIEVAELTYTRELDAPTGSTGDATIEGSVANLYTICLAETPTSAANAKYYTLDAANSTTLTFVEVNSLAANTPYLVAVTSGSDLNESQNVTNVTLKKEADNSTEKDGFAFKGTLTGLSNADAAAAGAYILQSGNVWGKVTTAKPAAFIPPFRAYIVSTTASAPDMLNGSLGDGNTTGIQNIRTIDMDGTECWYDLNGKRIQKPTKGINIKNGRKVVIK